LAAQIWSSRHQLRARAHIVEERLGGKFRRAKLGRANDALTAEKARKPVQSSSAAWPAGAKKAQAKARAVTITEVSVGCSRNRARTWGLASLREIDPRL
jgi:hypothetical protein